jgi:hypothetical protein
LCGYFTAGLTRRGDRQSALARGNETFPHSMKLPKIFAALLFLFFAGTSWAAEAQNVLHWYSITVTTGQSTDTFTGSTTLDSKQFAVLFTAIGPIELDNLRELTIRAGESAKDWHPNEEVTKIFILPRSVIYYCELPGDPVSHK